MYVCVLCAYMLPVETREGVGPPETEVLHGCDLPCGAGNSTLILSYHLLCFETDRISINVPLVIISSHVTGHVPFWKKNETKNPL